MLNLNVSGMTCGHCAAAVTNAVKGVPAVESVEVDLNLGKVTVGGNPDETAVRQAIADEGYDVAA
jgi:copper chaperone